LPRFQPGDMALTRASIAGFLPLPLAAVVPPATVDSTAGLGPAGNRGSSAGRRAARPSPLALLPPVVPRPPSCRRSYPRRRCYRRVSPDRRHWLPPVAPPLPPLLPPALPPAGRRAAADVVSPGRRALAGYAGATRGRGATASWNCLLLRLWRRLQPPEGWVFPPVSIVPPVSGVAVLAAIRDRTADARVLPPSTAVPPPGLPPFSFPPELLFARACAQGQGQRNASQQCETNRILRDGRQSRSLRS